MIQTVAQYYLPDEKALPVTGADISRWYANLLLEVAEAGYLPDDIMLIKTYHRETPIPLCKEVKVDEQYMIFIGSTQPVYTRSGEVTNSSGYKFWGNIPVIGSDSGSAAISVHNKCLMGITVERYRGTSISGYVNFKTIQETLRQYKNK